MYRILDSDKIVATVVTLRARIEERFPSSGLLRVCQELLAISRESQERAAWIARPQYVLRVAIGVLIATLIAGLAYTVSQLRMPTGGFDAVRLIQASDSGVNLLIFLGVSILFLITAETRIKRARAIKAIHELRALAHVIDMHQLTKDPDRLLTTSKVTPSSPPAQYERFRIDEVSRLLQRNAIRHRQIGGLVRSEVQRPGGARFRERCGSPGYRVISKNMAEDHDTQYCHGTCGALRN